LVGGPKRIASPIEALLAKVISEGGRLLAELAKDAVSRLLASPGATIALNSLWTDEERQRLTHELAAATATAAALARSLVLDHAERAKRKAVKEGSRPGSRNGQNNSTASGISLSEGSSKGSRTATSLAIPVRLQDTDWTCGDAAMEAVLDYLGIEVSEAEMVRVLRSDPKEGTSAKNLAALAKQLGLSVEERFGTTLDDVQHALERNAPVLAAVTEEGIGHWVVICGVADSVTIMDPTRGIASIPLAQWDAAWHDSSEGLAYDHYALAIGLPVQEACRVHTSPPLSTLHRLLEDVRLPSLQPESALDFFRSLVPTLSTDLTAFTVNYRQQAFTTVLATETDLLKSLQGVILDRLQSGQVSTGPRAIQAVLDAAGVSPNDPRHAETLFRTEAMTAYNTAASDEIAAQAATFPVWSYSNPSDSRSRPSHAERDGNYYPASIPFAQVRGTGKEDSINCRCVPIPIDRWTWSELKAAGARIAAGYPDVPGESAVSPPTPTPASAPVIQVPELPRPTPVFVPTPIPAFTPAPPSEQGKINAWLGSKERAGNLVGAPPGATVKVSTSEDRPDMLRIDVRAPGIELCERYLGVDEQGRKYIRNEAILLTEQGHGQGTAIFGSQVEQASQNGVAYIEAHASKGPDQNGYYTWPRLGYDQSLESIAEQGARDAKVAAAARKAFPSAQSVLDVMSTPEGRDWWKKHGTDMEQAVFDLTPGSRSRQILDAYQREKRKG
jgi:predicted double-glycine peptidase